MFWSLCSNMPISSHSEQNGRHSANASEKEKTSSFSPYCELRQDMLMWIVSVQEFYTAFETFGTIHIIRE